MKRHVLKTFEGKTEPQVIMQSVANLTLSLANLDPNPTSMILLYDQEVLTHFVICSFYDRKQFIVGAGAEANNEAAHVLL